MGCFWCGLPGKSEVHIHPQSFLQTGFLKGFGQPKAAGRGGLVSGFWNGE